MSTRMRVSSKWNSKRIDIGGGTSGRRSSRADTVLGSDILEPSGLEIVEVRELTPKARRREAVPPDIDVSVSIEKDEAYVLALRHPSGAITFHAPAETTKVRRGRASHPSEVRFRVAVRGTPAPGGRRSIASKIFKAVLVKVVAKVADKAIGWLARKWEEKRWKKKGIAEGWLEVDQESLASGVLRPATLENLPTAPARSLLLLHGTFSNAAGGFGDLAAPGATFFKRVQTLYDGHVYAFNHFTVSKTPEENAKEFLAALPSGKHVFDVVTHSRGGLVLRLIAEQGSQFGAAAQRFQLGHGVLVASPNDGTPLATPSRWESTVGWLATLLEVFPENPLTTTAEFISEAIVWLARRIPGATPGVGSMDSMGETIDLIQGAPHPAPSAYSALVANFEPSETLLLKAADIGVDAFFSMDNDLVVPTAGGWIVSDSDASLIPDERIGRFGTGGNLPSAENVYHNNFFAQPETVDFIVAALAREPQRLRPHSRAGGLVTRRAPRGLDVEVGERAGAPAIVGPRAEDASRATAAPELGVFTAGSAVRQPPFVLTLLPATLHPGAGPRDGDQAGPQSMAEWDDELLLLATYGNARAVERFYKRGNKTDAGRRFQKIIQTHERIKAVVNGEMDKDLPTDKELIEYGILLFNTLFPGQVRRLYDVARSRHLEMATGRRDRVAQLDVIFTSMISWIADKPWEFAFDPARRTYLATEETHFTRNVVTAVPAQTIEPRTGPLDILVVSAQPVGAGGLSIEQETEVISRGFQVLVDAGLARVTVMPSATPGELHDRVSRQPFDVVHFIGHGEYDEKTDTGTLLFVDERGGTHTVNDRTLREILCRRGIRTVFLNACETARGGRADFNSGVAPALVAGGVPTVIANQYSVLDVSATLYAQNLYWSLAQGMTIGAAAREARIAVNYSLSGESIDWAVPVVFTRNPQEVICSGTARAGQVAQRSALRAAAVRRRRTEPQREVQVAVWDVSYAFPDLQKTLERMNGVQDRFGFQRVDVTAPIGAWRKLEYAEDKTTVKYLHADQVARKLKHIPGEYGVNYLMCITDEYLMDDEWLNLYGWGRHDEDEKPERVLFFSTAGFELEPGLLSTERAIANEITGMLAMVRSGIALHPTGAKSCPFFENIDRDESLITQEVKIDRSCAAYIRRKIPTDLKAIQALYRAFDG